ncbi:MAG: M56 family metallopeptidase [Marinilabiliales bacterium]|nr:M56 family metallopeptidase [Marinilabiliales bacterium]
MLVYAVESSICLTLLWAFHEIALRRDTRHRRNRYYLLGSMIFSLVVPLLNIRIEAPGSLLQPGGLASFLLPETVVTPAGSEQYAGIFTGLLPRIYAIGLIISAGSIVAGAAGLIKLTLNGKRNGRVIVFDSDSPACFSAFGFVFISSSVSDGDAGRMINHEMKHIGLGHHTDLLIAGLITIVQWFNPAAYLIRRSLQSVHEYEADSECITGGEDPVSYQELLLAYVFRSPAPVFSNTFSKRSLLKNRIIMMTKKRTGGSASLKLILAIPLAMLMVLLFSCKDRSEVKKEAASVIEKAATAAEEYVAPDEVFMVVEKMPVFQNDTTYAALTKWIGENIKYPDEAKKKGTQGRVFVRFTIDYKGNVKDPEIVRSVDPLLDKAALDVISACPQWSPGFQGGKPVNVGMTLPISFALN